MASIKCGKCAGTHTDVAAVRACYAGRLVTKNDSTKPQPSAPFEPVATAPATDKQISFLKSLASERDTTGTVWSDLVAEVLRGAVISKADASKAIGFLLERPKVAPAAATPQADARDLSDGIFLDGDTIYKVYKAVHGSDQQCVKMLEVTSEVVIGVHGAKAAGVFAYLGLAAKHLPMTARRMTLEEAKAFGKIYGFCVKCGRTLTDENSIAAGIGPICAGKGW